MMLLVCFFMENIDKEPKKLEWAKPLAVFARLSSWMVFPVLLGVFIGNWLDNKYHTAPKLFLLSVGVAFLLSSVGLVVSALKEYKKYEL